VDSRDDCDWRDGREFDEIYHILGTQWTAPTLVLPARCPRCDTMTVHLFFHRNPYNDGKTGGGWAWCSQCRGFGHGLWKIPEWWLDMPDLPDNALLFAPIIMDQIAKRIDAHWNRVRAAYRHQV